MRTFINNNDQFLLIVLIGVLFLIHFNIIAFGLLGFLMAGGGIDV